MVPLLTAASRSDELYLLDYRNQQAKWMSVPTAGNTPGRRYGHSLARSATLFLARTARKRPIKYTSHISAHHSRSVPFNTLLL